VSSVEALESPGTGGTSETTATTDVTAAFAALGTQPKGLFGLPAQTSASGENRQNLDERPAVDLAERNRVAGLRSPLPATVVAQ
jgi:hypothetical protein